VTICPNDRPPAIRKRTSESSLRISCVPRIPVVVKTTIGRNDAAAADRPDERGTRLVPCFPGLGNPRC